MTFNPTNFNFTLIKDFKFPGNISVYEYKNHITVDGKPNVLRLNLYLSKDGDFVTIWHGLLDPVLVNITSDNHILQDLDLFEQYQETLFRGYIESNENAHHILDALKINTLNAHFMPQILQKDINQNISCQLLS